MHDLSNWVARPSAMSSAISGSSSRAGSPSYSFGGFYDAELEKTHAHALFILLLPGLFLLCWYNLIPFFKRGNEFRIEPDGSVAVQAGGTWPALLEYEYVCVDADGRTIEFSGPQGGNRLTLPQQRVFSREYGVRLPSKISAEFFSSRLRLRGFDVDQASSSDHFTAKRLP